MRYVIKTLYGYVEKYKKNGEDEFRNPYYKVGYCELLKNAKTYKNRTTAMNVCEKIYGDFKHQSDYECTIEGVKENE